MDRPSSVFLTGRRFSSARGGILRRAAIIPALGLSALVGAIPLAGCERPTSGAAAEVPADPGVVHADPTILRVRSDPVRNQTWILALDHVEVYDRVTRHLIRRIDLPPWSVADRVCQPDIVFDAGGTAFISHNLEPRLWQIQANDFGLKEHTLRLVGKEHLDIGFGGLTMTSDGTLIGKASTGGSLWVIDLEGATAHEMEHAPGAPERGFCSESM
jgi:hypothetical protein